MFFQRVIRILTPPLYNFQFLNFFCRNTWFTMQNFIKINFSAWIFLFNINFKKNSKLSLKIFKNPVNPSLTYSPISKMVPRFYFFKNKFPEFEPFSNLVHSTRPTLRQKSVDTLHKRQYFLPVYLIKKNWHFLIGNAIHFLSWNFANPLLNIQPESSQLKKNTLARNVPKEFFYKNSVKKLKVLFVKNYDFLIHWTLPYQKLLFSLNFITTNKNPTSHFLENVKPYLFLNTQHHLLNPLLSLKNQWFLINYKFYNDTAAISKKKRPYSLKWIVNPLLKKKTNILKIHFIWFFIKKQPLMRAISTPPITLKKSKFKFKLARTRVNKKRLKSVNLINWMSWAVRYLLMHLFWEYDSEELKIFSKNRTPRIKFINFAEFFEKFKPLLAHYVLLSKISKLCIKSLPLKNIKKVKSFGYFRFKYKKINRNTIVKATIKKKIKRLRIRKFRLPKVKTNIVYSPELYPDIPVEFLFILTKIKEHMNSLPKKPVLIRLKFDKNSMLKPKAVRTKKGAGKNAKKKANTRLKKFTGEINFKEKKLFYFIKKKKFWQKIKKTRVLHLLNVTPFLLNFKFSGLKHKTLLFKTYSKISPFLVFKNVGSNNVSWTLDSIDGVKKYVFASCVESAIFQKINQLVYHSYFKTTFALPPDGFLYLTYNHVGSLAQTTAEFKKMLFSFPTKYEMHRQIIKLSLKAKIFNLFTSQPSNLINVPYTPRFLKTSVNNVSFYTLTNELNILQNNKLHPLPYLQNSNVDFRPNFSLKRIKFKPGYRRLWKESRSVAKISLNVKYRYEYKFTQYLLKFNKFARMGLIIPFEMSLFNILKQINFFFYEHHIDSFLQSKSVFVNGRLCFNKYLQIYSNDFIQFTVTTIYYIAYKYILNFFLKRKIKLKIRLKKKAANAEIGLTKKKSSTFPSWLLFEKNVENDLIKFIEMDFFSLSFFILYEPFLLTDLNSFNSQNARYSVLKMYNWKYIT